MPGSATSNTTVALSTGTTGHTCARRSGDPVEVIVGPRAHARRARAADLTRGRCQASIADAHRGFSRPHSPRTDAAREGAVLMRAFPPPATATEDGPCDSLPPNTS